MLEQKEVIEPELLDKIAKAVNLPAAAVKNLNDVAAIDIIANVFANHSSAVSYYPSFNPVDKVAELYERMLKEKSELIEKLQATKRK